MKVRMSQIPEDNGKPQNFRTKIKPNRPNPVEDDDDENMFEENEEEKKRIYKIMIHLPEVGLSINIFGIESIEKVFQVVESNYGNEDVTKCQYGIVINKDIEPSIRFPKNDIYLWFNSEEVRDKRYDKIIEFLSENGIKFIVV